MRGDFRKKKNQNVSDWYDLYEDWDLVVSSFASQYGIREEDISIMEWGEFRSLLIGIMPETPLGRIVQIRAEEDKEVLNHFAPEQHSIRNAWRSRNPIVDRMSEDEKKESVLKLQDIFAKAFG